MEYIRNIGYLSDCIFHNYNGSVEFKGDYYVIRTPENPTYHWGNFLLFKREPRVADFDTWLEAFRSEFGGDSSHVTFGWDSERPGAVADFVSNGFELSEDAVLSLSELRPLSRPNTDIKIRKVKTAKDWQAVSALHALSYENDAYAEFRERLLLSYRSIQQKGHGDWWGAFLGNTLVGSLGLYFSPDQTLGRFQHVDTHPEHRKNGICTTLLHHVAQMAIKTSDSLELIIVTEKDHPATRIYRSLGFEDCARQYGASLPRPFSARFEADTADKAKKPHV